MSTGLGVPRQMGANGRAHAVVGDGARRDDRAGTRAGGHGEATSRRQFVPESILSMHCFPL